jgi:hypothetical protein
MSHLVSAFIAGVLPNKMGVNNTYNQWRHQMYMVEDAGDGDFLGVICFRTHKNAVAVIDAIVLRGDARRKTTAQALFAQVKRYEFSFQTAQMYYLIPNHHKNKTGDRLPFTAKELDILEQEHK